ncbi:hypothetical protein AB4Y36_19425 [Paraburkholderia sp. BR10936]|uniref:hypothetical protein n=1 Tax=Paraburkholderia sp. BR10936 TaxID=3236993 RepID=UPI0034D1916B
MNARILELARTLSSATTAAAAEVLCFTPAQILAFAHELTSASARGALSPQQLDAVTIAAAAVGISPAATMAFASRAQEALHAGHLGRRGADVLAELATETASVHNWDETNDGVHFGEFWTFERDALEDFAHALINRPAIEVPAGWALVPRPSEGDTLHS